MKNWFTALLLFWTIGLLHADQGRISLLRSTASELVFQVTTVYETQDDIRPFTVLIGLPTRDLPRVQTTFLEILSVTEIDSSISRSGIRWTNHQSLQGLMTGSLEISPILSSSTIAGKIIITIPFDAVDFPLRTASVSTSQLLKTRVLNWNVARHWIQPEPSSSQKRVMRQEDFPAGNWLLFEISEDGTYAIPGELILSTLTNTTDIAVDQIRLYTHSSGGRDRMRPFLGRFNNTNLYQPVPENLVECAIRISGNGDAVLDANDKLIFYGQGASGFDYKTSGVTYNQNVYYLTNKYWIFIPLEATTPGKRVALNTYEPQNPVSLDYGTVFQHVEYDLTNQYASGLVWVGPTILKNSTYPITVRTTGIKPTIPGHFRLVVFGGYSGSSIPLPTHSLRLYALNTTGTPLTSIIYSGTGRRTTTGTVDVTAFANGLNQFFLTNNASSAISQPYFDYFTFDYARTLDYSGEPYQFYAPSHSGEFQFEFNTNQNPEIWDVTNLFEPVRYSLSLAKTFSYLSKVDTLHHFVVFTPDDIPVINTLVNEGQLSFNTLRNQESGVKHLIVGPEAFRAAAEPLRQHRVSSRYAALEDIYQEFSGGNPDPFAIHSLIQWAMENWTGLSPEYVLFLGDADYDYRNMTGRSKTIVPTIEVGESFSHATDDRFASIHGKIPELAIGRYPAHSEQDVVNFVQKIISYETEPELGIWRTRVTLVADDAARPEKTLGEVGIGKSHSRNSENIAAQVAPGISIQKLYMMEYPEVSNASTFGVVKPEATAALLDYVEQGTAIINYIGHGSAHQWAQENLFLQDRDLDLIDSGMKLPLWIAGTCSWGHFDDLDAEAFSEDIIRLPNDGAFGIITTTRPISVSSNEFYEEQIFQALFPNNRVTDLPIGHILLSAKTGNTSGEYFQLFGDPASPLPIPADTVTISQIVPDTLRTLDTARVTGHQSLGSEGIGYVVLKDADREVTRQYTFLATEQTLSYTLPGATLFRGQFSYLGNQFSARLRLPNDFSYSTTPGRLSVYLIAGNNPPREAIGYYSNIPIRGGGFVQDNEGPIISFWDDTFSPLYSGDHFNKSRSLIIQLEDPIGINLTNDIGHEITVTDMSSGQQINVTDRFVYNPNSITKGYLKFEPEVNMDNLELTVKAWDSANNPSEAIIRLVMTEDAVLRLHQVYNYPNPFSDDTQFTFEITAAADVSITIFTLSGRRIMHIDEEYFEAGYHFINWDGQDEFGDNIANGTYLYQIKAKGAQKAVSEIGRCAKFQ
ncbi:MAG: type IX secretion system sortase PorU [Fidelibacterota bacterium]